MKSAAYNTLVCVAAIVVGFLTDQYFASLWRHAFIEGHPYPVSFGLIRWGELIQWTYSAIFGMILGVVLASLIRGPSPTKWVVGFGACFGLLQFLIAGHQFTSAASFLDRAWTYTEYLVPALAMYVGAKIRLGTEPTRVTTTRNIWSIGIFGRRVLICLVIFLAAAAADELLRRPWGGLFGHTFKVYFGWLSGIYAVRYLFDLSLFFPIGLLIGFLFPGPASARWALGVGLLYGFLRFLQITHDFTAMARWHDYAAAYFEYLVPPLSAYLGVVVWRVARKVRLRGSSAA